MFNDVNLVMKKLLKSKNYLSYIEMIDAPIRLILNK